MKNLKSEFVLVPVLFILSLALMILDSYAVDEVNWTNQTEADIVTQEAVVPQEDVEDTTNQTEADEVPQEAVVPQEDVEDTTNQTEADEVPQEAVVPQEDVEDTTNQTEADEVPQERDGGSKEMGSESVILVRTSIENHCQPRPMCEILEPGDFFQTEVDTVKNDDRDVVGIFPASEEGTPVKLIADPNQITYYLVRQVADNRNPSLLAMEGRGQNLFF